MCLIVIGDEKTLYPECDGHFSTAPGGIPLLLTDIVEHLKDSFPLNAILFLDSDLCNDHNIVHLASTVVTLTQVSTESSIIATSCFDENDASLDIDEDAIPVAIPTDLKITLTVLKKQSENESLNFYEDTHNIVWSKVQAVSSSHCNNDYMALKQSEREEYEYQSLEPSKLYSDNQAGLTPKPTNSNNKPPQVS